MTDLLKTLIVAALIISASCKEDKEKESEGNGASEVVAKPQQKPDPKGGDTNDPLPEENGTGTGSSGESTPTPPKYDPKIGDTLQSSSKSKSWSSAVTEPADFSAELSRESLVIATYQSSAACGYRVRETNAGLVSFRNEKCPVAPLCDTPTDTSKCQTESQGTEDVGEIFKSSAKEKSVCTSKEVRGQETVLVKTTTYTWKHPKVLRESMIAKSETLSCTVTLAAGEAEFDPCNPPAGKVVSFARSIDEVKTQTRGRGGPSLPTSAFAKVTSADLVAPPKGVTLPATCEVANDAMSISIQHASCDAQNALKTVGISIRGIAPAEGRDSSIGANNVVMSIGDDDYSSAVIGDCVISVVKDSKSVLVTGDMECRKKLQGENATATKALDSVKFACSAPTGFVGLEQAMAEQTEKANAASKPTSGESGSGSGSRSGTGTGSGSSASTTTTTRAGGATNTNDGQIIFASSFKTTGDIRFGNLRGRSAADAWCTDVATKANITGPFRSVLSVGANANARMHALVKGKVYNKKGDVIALTEAEFWTSMHKAAIKYDETGKDVSEDGQVFIGAFFDGSHHTFQACNDFTRGANAAVVRASVGNAARTDLAWIEAAKNVDCGSMSRVYCLQQK